MSAKRSSGIDLVNVGKRYGAPGVDSPPVLDGVSLQIRDGEFVALMGPSGSGKSTLLNLVGALLRAESGEVLVGDQNIGNLSESRRAKWRAENIGFVFQAFNLIPVLRAHENVELPLLALGMPGSARRRAANAAMKLTSIAEKTKSYPRQLSGGQQQRVAIARAIVADPPILLCDEPTGNLDSNSSAAILDLLEFACRELGKTIVMVTHDPSAARRAGRVLHLDKGRLSAIQTPP